MKIYIISFFVLFLAIDSLKAKIWRVNNISGSGADFTSLFTAVSTATSGDTIHVEPSPSTYSVNGVNIDKKLFIYGNGYFLDQNSNLQANTDVSGLYTSSGSMIFSPGSEGSIISGVAITGFSSGRLQINADSIVVKSNFLYRLSINSSSIFILRNYIDNNISFGGSASNCYAFNNILPSLNSSSSFGHQFINNTIISGGSITSCRVQNNIFYAGGGTSTVTFTNCEVQNNLSGGSLPAGDGNQSNVDMNTVFIGSGSTDGQWQLAVASPAEGQGFYGGEDCGAFGVPPNRGWIPYKLSGIPDIPSIYEFSTTFLGDTLQVNFSTRSNN